MSKEKIKIEKPQEDSAVAKEGKVGTMLRDVRIKKKLSIEEISEQLRIKAVYLSAIEQSDYDNIPQPPYGIGFVRSYAAYLGLNSARIVQIFKEETQGGSKEILVDKHTEQHSEDESETEIYSPNIKYIIISMAMLLVGYMLWSYFSSKAYEEETIDSAQITVSDEEYPLQIENFVTETQEQISEQTLAQPQINVTEEEFKEDNIPANTESVANKNPKNSTTKKTLVTNKQGRVILKIKKETWVEVKDDNKLWLSKVMQAGSEYVVPGDGLGKTVSFGNTDGVDVMIDGKIVTIVSQNKKTNIKLDAFLSNH